MSTTPKLSEIQVATSVPWLQSVTMDPNTPIKLVGRALRRIETLEKERKPRVPRKSRAKRERRMR